MVPSTGTLTLVERNVDVHAYQYQVEKYFNHDTHEFCIAHAFSHAGAAVARPKRCVLQPWQPNDISPNKLAAMRHLTVVASDHHFAWWRNACTTLIEVEPICRT